MRASLLQYHQLGIFIIHPSDYCDDFLEYQYLGIFISLSLLLRPHTTTTSSSYLQHLDPDNHTNLKEDACMATLCEGQYIE